MSKKKKGKKKLNNKRRKRTINAARVGNRVYFQGRHLIG